MYDWQITESTQLLVLHMFEYGQDSHEHLFLFVLNFFHIILTHVLQKSDIVLRFPLLLPVRPHTYPPTSSLTFVSLAIHSSLGHQSGGEIITMYIDSWHRRFRSDVILEHFQAHAGRRMGPGSSQNMTLEHFHAHAAEWVQEAPRT